MNRWMSPYAAMSVILAMYVVKIAAKLSVGYAINSPMIVGDGWHNVSDIIEALLVILMLWLSSRPKSDHYPFGRKNAESLVALSTGIGLLALAAKLAAQSALSLLALVPVFAGPLGVWNPFPREPLVTGGVGSVTFWLALAVTAGCGALSFVASRYQIAVGRKTNHPSLVADGEETKSDGYVELIAAAGILSVHFTGIPKLEDAFTLFIAWKLSSTGRELFLGGWHALLQHSLGKEVEEAIRTATMRLAGAAKVADLKTFKVGAQAVVIIKVHTRASLEATRMMKKALCERIATLLDGHGFAESDVYARFDCPSPDEHRLAYALGSDGRIATAIADAASFRICGMIDGDVERARDVTPAGGFWQVIELLRSKRVAEVRIRGEGVPKEKAACEAAGLRYVTVEHGDPAAYGCDKDDDLS